MRTVFADAIYIAPNVEALAIIVGTVVVAWAVYLVWHDLTN